MRRGFQPAAPNGKGDGSRFAGRGSSLHAGRGGKGGQYGQGRGMAEGKASDDEAVVHLIRKGHMLPHHSLWEHVAPAVNRREGPKKKHVNGDNGHDNNSGRYLRHFDHDNDSIAASHSATTWGEAPQTLQGKDGHMKSISELKSPRNAGSAHRTQYSAEGQGSEKSLGREEDAMEADLENGRGNSSRAASDHDETDCDEEKDNVMLSEEESDDDVQCSKHGNDEEGSDSDADNGEQSALPIDSPNASKQLSQDLGESNILLNKASSTPWMFKAEECRKRVKERRDYEGSDKKQKAMDFADVDQHKEMMEAICKETLHLRTSQLAVRVQITFEKVAERLDEQKKWILLYFMGKTVSNLLLRQWGDAAAGKDAFSHFIYLGKGVYIAYCKEYSIVYTLLEKSVVWAAGLFSLVLPWDPRFDPLHNFMNVCLVWVTFQNISILALPFLQQMAESLGKILHLPRFGNFVHTRNVQACVLLDMNRPIPNRVQMDVGLKDSLCTEVHFSSFPHACYKCRQVGHFAKACKKQGDEKTREEEKIEGQINEDKNRKIEIVIPIEREHEENLANKETRNNKQKNQELQEWYETRSGKFRVPALMKKAKRGGRKLFFNDGLEVSLASFLQKYKLKEDDLIFKIS